ncbi:MULTISPECIES: succinylglutamate desuccinylase/aspartoacylase family protein [Caballeronia]|uniref:Succinylglutamate desuccinylase n=1 Tax=Caballeronia zhejiangensis TaxID=871203 RepID=A0A656QD23_9BURK|nr:MULTISPECIES: succinylglutamate desuccinylase/aspartoacylase family protein [Caballeronia]EKS66338.1 succinylglutamate desuccinylase/aspartoacylase [Burkholderia sp. SJ98]KDR28022.1 succinylglutamate desuccinylase [Caballeronia zhejiangensis]MDR5789098.1 M14 family metallopeptidase [Caballeronia sp. LP003]
MHTQRHPLVSTTLGTSRELASFHFGDAANGESVYLQASLHADETPAMLTAWTLKQRLAALEAEGRMRGEIVLVPVANPIGLSQHVLGQFLGRFEANSGHNFNRDFPMPSAAALIERVGARLSSGDAAHNARLLRGALVEMLGETTAKNEFESLRLALLGLASKADVVLDLHCSLEATMHIYTSPASWPAIEPLARYLGANGVLLATDSGGQSFDEVHALLWNELRERLGDATPLGAPNIAATIEHRGQRDVDYDTASHDAEAIVDYLIARGVIEGEAKDAPPLAQAATPLAGSQQLTAPASGIVVYRAKVGARLQAGDPVFDIVDPVTDSVTTVTTANGGVFYMRRAVRFVYAGAPMGRVTGEKAIRSGVLIGA